MPPATMSRFRYVVRNMRVVREAETCHCRHRQRGQADQKIYADGELWVEFEDGDQEWQAELRAAKTDQPAEYGNGGTSAEGGEWAADRVEALFHWLKLRAKGALSPHVSSCNSANRPGEIVKFTGRSANQPRQRERSTHDARL